MNAVWWGSLLGYGVGLVYMLALAGMQYLTFIYHVLRPEPTQPATDSPFENLPQTPAVDYRHRGALAERLRRDRDAGHSHAAAQSYGNIHRDPVAYARRQRYSDSYAHQRAADRRSVADRPVRSDADPKRR
jgi:hypothetical protein